MRYIIHDIIISCEAKMIAKNMRIGFENEYLSIRYKDKSVFITSGYMNSSYHFEIKYGEEVYLDLHVPENRAYALTQSIIKEILSW